MLDYEEALTRRDSTTGDWYDCSAHLLWIGERTRGVDDAHVEFLSGVHNPLAVKLGPTATPEETLELCERLNPARVPGRLTLVARMGANAVFDLLPPLLRAVREADHPVVWLCDPMHANVFKTAGGVKTRRFDDVMTEIEGFFAGCRGERVWPGGVHLEFTGEDVTECLGGGEAVLEEQLSSRYMTLCDPRLNARQSLDLAFRARRADAPVLSRCSVAVVGTGLMGASVGLAAARRGDEVTGWDPDDHALAAAVERGAVARASSLGDALQDADLAVVAAPIAHLPAQVASVLGGSRDDTTVTDVGSTKTTVVAAAGGSPRFVGGHPICGSEARGAEHATADLFEGATWFVTPTARTDPARHRLVHGFVSDLGATPVAIAPDAHDRLVALTSHVPHVLAERDREPERGGARRGARPAAERRRIAPRHDAGRRGEPTDLDRHPARQRDGGARGARRAPAAHRPGRGGARRGRRRVPRAVDRRGGDEPPPDARHAPTPTRARSTGSACTSRTARACSPASPRRSAQTGSTSTTSSFSTCRRSEAER